MRGGAGPAEEDGSGSLQASVGGKGGGAQKASHRRREKLNTKERDKDGPF